MFDFEELFDPESVIVVDELPSRKTALRSLAESFAKSDTGPPAREIFFKLQEREREGSTVLDDLPVAIPHCRIDGYSTAKAALLKTRDEKGVDFGGARVRLILGMCFPAEATGDALEILRLVVKVFGSEGRTKDLLAADSNDELYRIFQGGLEAEASS